MKLRVAGKTLAPPDSTSYIDRYLNEVIDYGGLDYTRGEAILDMQRMGMTQPEIDRWLQGNEFAQRLRERRLGRNKGPSPRRRCYPRPWLIPN